GGGVVDHMDDDGGAGAGDLVEGVDRAEELARRDDGRGALAFARGGGGGEEGLASARGEDRVADGALGLEHDVAEVLGGSHRNGRRASAAAGQVRRGDVDSLERGFGGVAPIVSSRPGGKRRS